MTREQREIVIVQNVHPNEIVAFEMSGNVIEGLIAAGIHPTVVNLHEKNDHTWVTEMLRDPEIRLKKMSEVAARYPERVVFDFQDSPVGDIRKNRLQVSPMFLADVPHGYVTVEWPAEYSPQTDEQVLRSGRFAREPLDWFFKWVSDVDKSVEAGLCKHEWVTSVVQEIIQRSLTGNGNTDAG